MKRLRFAASAGFVGLLLCGARPALAIGIGIEGGGMATYASGLGNGAPSTAGSGELGVIVENKFDITLVFLDLWADVQTPMRLQVGQSSAAQYIPIDLGLRFGFNLGPVQPYLGIVGQVAINNDSGGGSVNNPVYGLGGDLGLDIAVVFLRFGVELRGVETVGDSITSPQLDGFASGSNSAFELEALASVRLSF